MRRLPSRVLSALILAATVSGQVGEAAEPKPIRPPVDNETLRAAAELLAGPPPARGVTWSGRIIGPDHAPLGGVDVWLYPDGPTQRALGGAPQLVPAWSGMGMRAPPMLTALRLSDCAHVVSGADGRFAVSTRLLATAPAGPLGLQPTPWTSVLVIGREGDACRVESSYRWDQTGTAVDLGDQLVVPEAAIAGRVVDAQGAPVAGALVSVVSQRVAPQAAEASYSPQAALLAERHATRTADDGRFRLGGLWPGRVDLSVDHPRHPVREVEGAVAPAGGTGAVADIALEEGLVLSGKVLDAQGRPVAGARVAAATRHIGMYGLGCCVSDFKPGDDTLPTEMLAAYADARVAWTDASGAFEIGGLVASSTQLFVEADGQPPCVVRELVPPVADVQVLLPAPAEVVVRVVTAADGQPVASARLSAVRRQQATDSAFSAAGSTDLALIAQPVPDAAGVFRVRCAGPVRTHLVAVAPGFAPTSTDVQGLKPGAQQSVELRLLPAATLAGRVTDPDGRALPDVTATLYPGENVYLPRVAEVHGDADGHFSFPSLGGGVFDLALTAPGRGGLFVRGLDTGTDLSPLALTLEPAARLQVSLHDGTGRAIERSAEISRSGVSRDEKLRTSFLIHHTVECDDSGLYSWDDLPAGPYTLKIRNQPDREVELRAGETTRVDLDGARGCRIEGRVTRSDEAVPGASVGLSTADASGGFDFSGWAETDEDGHYVAWIPAAERCRMSVQAQAWNEADDGPVPGVLSVPAVTVDIAGRTGLKVDIACPSGSLAGQLVRAGTGEPLAAETVQIAGSDYGENLAQTDEHGRFLFLGAADGEYVVERLSSGPIVPAQSPGVQVRDGQPVRDIRIEVPHGARLLCSLRRPNGLPAPDGSTLTIYKVGSCDGAVWGHSVAGHCLVDELCAGHYRIEYTPAGQLSVSHEDAIAQELDLPEDGEAQVEFVVEG